LTIGSCQGGRALVSAAGSVVARGAAPSHQLVDADEIALLAFTAADEHQQRKPPPERSNHVHSHPAFPLVPSPV
jgi:hypothetical protein